MEKLLNTFIDQYCEAFKELKYDFCDSEWEMIKRIRGMIHAVQTTDWNHDWLKYNPAMRLAARRCGMKTSKALRDWCKSFPTIAKPTSV
jgi:hypothetical protein